MTWLGCLTPDYSTASKVCVLVAFFTRHPIKPVPNPQLPTLWEPGLIFMQYGASIHTAHIIKRLFADNAIEVVNWSLNFSESQSDQAYLKTS